MGEEVFAGAWHLTRGYMSEENDMRTDFLHLYKGNNSIIRWTITQGLRKYYLWMEERRLVLGIG